MRPGNDRGQYFVYKQDNVQYKVVKIISVSVASRCPQGTYARCMTNHFLRQMCKRVIILQLCPSCERYVPTLMEYYPWDTEM